MDRPQQELWDAFGCYPLPTACLVTMLPLQQHKDVIQMMLHDEQVQSPSSKSLASKPSRSWELVHDET